VHYTSADTALKIVDYGVVWMRKSRVMNDFSEFDYGLHCLRSALAQHKERYQQVFDGIFPGFCDTLHNVFESWIQPLANQTFIACISEHDDLEDKTGRLSMWRAYGNPNGVAIVMKGEPFLRASDALSAYDSSVAYLSVDQFADEFLEFLNGIEANKQAVEAMGEKALRGHMFEVFSFACLCTKHPGFAEEREWRIIYSPEKMRSRFIKEEIETVAGVPQVVQKLPLKNVPDEGLVGIEPHELVDRIIIGPTQFPHEIAEAFLSVLETKGIPDAASKIVVSDIPLRT
jgi:hypothetical protein